MPLDSVEQTKQVKAASDIVAVVGTYLAVKPAGKIFKCLCPFHNDSRPSLDVDPGRQRYKCWSCGAHGDVFAFVQHMEKVGFREARQILADRAGIKLDDQASPQDQHRTKLLEVMRWAQGKYAYQLLEDECGAAARTYLGERKLAGKSIREFGLGFAPLNGDWLVKLAAAEGVSADALVEVGLIAQREGGRGYYDRFRDRVMFPIRDVRGQTVGFGGRIMPNSPYAARAPKYYNSAETTLFSKSLLLYGLDLARHGGTSAGFLAVVEGYTDVMMAHQCGVPQVVATMGTALNAKHVAQLRRYVPKVVLVYDADAGGFSGVDRALEIFVSQDAELAVATLPDGLDPCDLLVRPGGIDTFKQVLTSAKDALDFKLDKLLETAPANSVEAQRRVLDDVLGIMANAPATPGQTAQVKRELIVTRLAHRLGVRQETAWARYSELRKSAEEREKQQQERDGQGDAKRPSGFVELRPAPRPDAAMPTTEKPRGGGGKAGPAVQAEMQLLDILLADPGLVPVAAARVTVDEITHSGLRRMLSELYAIQAAGAVPEIEALRARLDDRPDLFEAAERRLFVGQQMNDREQWLQRVFKWFADSKAKAKANALKEQLAAAPDSAQAVEDLLRRLQQANGSE